MIYSTDTIYHITSFLSYEEKIMFMWIFRHVNEVEEYILYDHFRQDINKLKRRYSSFVISINFNDIGYTIVDGYIDRKPSGYWIGSTSITQEHEVIHAVPTYSNTRSLCGRLVRTDEDKILKVQFPHDIKHKFNLSDLHEFKNVSGYFWFHEKCRCSHCDKIKIACVKSNTKFYRTEKEEYDHPEKKTNFTFGISLRGKSHDIKTKSPIDGHTFIKHIDKVMLIKGDATKTIPKFCKSKKALFVKLLYLDCPIYKPTITALKYFYPLMPKGSIIAFDELGMEKWKGESIAFKEFFSNKKLKINKFYFEPSASYVIK